MRRAPALRYLLAGAALALSGAAPAPVADILLQGGTIFDGSDRPAFVGDVAISGDKISYVGRAAGIRARRTINVRGLIVAPGLIDPHTHAETDGATPARRRLENWLAQGVTTIVIGNDGAGTPDIAGQTRALAAAPIGPNLASHVGFGAVRLAVLGEGDGAPDAAQLAEMQALVARAMCDGALGLSAGLFYPPQKYARTEEVIAVAGAAARRGGFYDTHLRDESSYGIGLLAAVDEALRIGREAGMPVHISHIKALGTDVQGQAPAVVARIAAARAAGQMVTADQYPYAASGSNLVAALLPGWAQAGGIDAIRARMADPAQRDRLRADMAENLRRRGGAHALLLTAKGRPWAGKRLDDVAAGWQVDAIAAALRIIDTDPDGSDVASFNMAEADIETFMRQPWVLTGSDGSAGHPRIAGTFPQKYAHYVRERHVLSLAGFIRQSSGRTADVLQLDHRGYLRPGWFADVVVFDPAHYAPQSDYAHPDALAKGVRTLVINGALAIVDGKGTALLPGRVLRRKPGPDCPSPP